MANEKNLKPWKPGQSGNPAGKPPGSKHLSSWIREMLNDKNFSSHLQKTRSGYEQHKGAPLKAILEVIIIKALDGDLKAFDTLAKYGYGTKLDVTTQGKKLALPVHGGIISLTDEQFLQLSVIRQSRNNTSEVRHCDA